MKNKNIPRIKICCISSRQEAQIAIECGAAALGLVGKMPSGPGIIDNKLINEIVHLVPPPISTFLLTSETNANSIIQHYKEVNTTTIQIVDALTDNGYTKIRSQLPHVKLVQVIHVIDNDSVNEAIHVSKYVDAVLLDSGNPKLKVKELGGTGRTHNWELSKIIREELEIPIFLAGGISANNVEKAIKIVNPFGLDLCSSVRTNNKLDKHKLQTFFLAIKKAVNY